MAMTPRNVCLMLYVVSCNLGRENRKGEGAQEGGPWTLKGSCQITACTMQLVCNIVPVCASATSLMSLTNCQAWVLCITSLQLTRPRACRAQADASAQAIAEALPTCMSAQSAPQHQTPSLAANRSSHCFCTCDESKLSPTTMSCISSAAAAAMAYCRYSNVMQLHYFHLMLDLMTLPNARQDGPVSATASSPAQATNGV